MVPAFTESIRELRLVLCVDSEETVKGAGDSRRP